MQVPLITYNPYFRYDHEVDQEIVQYRSAETGRVAMQIPAEMTVQTMRQAIISPVIAAMAEVLLQVSVADPLPPTPAPPSVKAAAPAAAVAPAPAEAPAPATVSIEA